MGQSTGDRPSGSQNGLIADAGGEKNLSTAKLILIEMIGRDVYFLDECDRRIFKPDSAVEIKTLSVLGASPERRRRRHEQFQGPIWRSARRYAMSPKIIYSRKPNDPKG